MKFYLQNWKLKIIILLYTDCEKTQKYPCRRDAVYLFIFYSVVELNNMRFVVPKFIEREAKIIGPLTFKQFLYLGGAGAILFAIYFMMPFSLFVVIAIILMGGAAAFAFVKMEGRSLLVIVKNFFMFFSSPKLYIWKRKTLSPKIIKKEKPKEEEKEIAPLPKITGSKLKDLSAKIETRT